MVLPTVDTGSFPSVILGLTVFKSGEQAAATLRCRSDRVYRYPEVNQPVAANNRSAKGRSAGGAVGRELDQLRKKVKELTLRLVREAKARKLEARLAAEAKKARQQLTGEIKVLREQGRKLASQLKATLGDAGKREQAFKEARAKVAELKVELGRRTADLRRKSAELRKLAEDSAHRSAAIIQGDAPHAAEPVAPEPVAPAAPSALDSESHPGDKPTPT